MRQQEVFAKLQDGFDGVFLQKFEVSRELPAKDIDERGSLTHVPFVDAFGICFRVREVETAKNLGALADVVVERLPKG